MTLQTKRKSIVEVCTNVGVGFCGSWALWEFVVDPMWGGFYITCFFTVWALIRGYVLRRIWNATD
jgi:hypothetical protein